MAITNGYATLTEAKARLGIPVADTNDDSIIENIVEASSRSIDRYCNRQFFQNAAQVRYYTAASDVLVFLDDCVSISAVSTDRNMDRTWSTVISTSDVELAPLNAAVKGSPYTELRMKPLASESFDLGLDLIKVTGTWGWPATPDMINEACLLLVSRLFRRKDSPFGVTGGGEVGQQVAIQAVDPDIRVLLDPYRRIGLIDLV
jgi:hypothetical protein